MIERLRRKFMMITMGSTILVMAVIISIINISNYIQIEINTTEILNILTANNGQFPQKIILQDDNGLVLPIISLETPYSTRFFTVAIDQTGHTVTIDTGKIAAISPHEAETYAAKVLQKGRASGIFDIYKYSVKHTDDGSLIVFLDCRKELNTFYSFLVTSIFVCLTSIISIFVLVRIFSKWAIKPFVLTYEKQKQFITDAGHELKTPLAVISANTEVMELECGESEWSQSTKKQIKRLSDLTKNLISLSRMEEDDNLIQLTDFSISDAASETAKFFEPLLLRKLLQFRLSLEENLTYRGDESAIRQLLTILLDNAVKYTPENGEIQLTLKKQGKKLQLSVYNTTPVIQKGNLSILFERFYRTDASRNSETGGNGIGLSIAKAIVTQHKGKIYAESADGTSILITAVL